MPSFSHCLAILLVLTSFFARAENEANLRQRWAALERNFQAGTTSTFKAKDGLRLSFHINEVAHAKGAVVFVNGRTESYLKYIELIADLNQRGYSVYAYDHRGQGLSSGRLSDDPDKGDIADFDLYVDDLKTFVDQVVTKRTHARLYLLAHSLGGLISLRYFERDPHHPFRAAVLSSPALGLNTGHSDATVGLLTCLSLRPTAYARGKGPADIDEPFEGNPLTSSRLRYEFYLSQMTGDPRGLTGNARVPGRRALIGGPTNRWVCETLHATFAAKQGARLIRTPLLIEAADDDQIVRVDDERVFCDRARDCRFILNPAKHEILIERDAIRDQALERLFDFFARH